MDSVQQEFSRKQPPSYASPYCITLIAGKSVEEVRASLLSDGGAWSVTPGPGPLSVREAGEWALDHFSSAGPGQAAFAVFGEQAGWAWSWEENGWLGSDAGAAVERSRGTRLVSTYKSEAICRFLYAVDGVVIRQFEALFHDRESGGQYGKPLPEEDGLDWSMHESEAAARTLQHRLTGVLMTDFAVPDGDAWGYVAL